MRIVGSASSPHVRKVRIVLAEKKLDFEFVPHRPAIDTHPPEPSYPGTIENIWGDIPCLITEGGERIIDSRVIVEYLDTLSPVGKLLPPMSRERAEVKTWEALADGLLEAASLAWLENHWEGRDASQRCQRWIDHQFHNIAQTLAILGSRLAEQTYCMGGHFCLADIAVGVALDYLDFRFPQWGWPDHHPNLASLQNRLSLRNSFSETRPAQSTHQPEQPQ